MYTPSAFAVTSHDEILTAVRRISFGHLVSTGPPGRSRLESTPLPFVVDDSLSELRGHVARGNRHWESLDGAEALMIVAGADAYVSPRWYASKAEHGRVVPTWNYEVVHLHGRVEIHDEREWKRAMVDDLTGHNEHLVDDPDRPETWMVSDAPARFVDAQLDAIVGLRMVIGSVEAKSKLSQNKGEADRSGVVAGLGRSSSPGAIQIASRMRSQSEV